MPRRLKKAIKGEKKAPVVIHHEAYPLEDGVEVIINYSDRDMEQYQTFYQALIASRKIIEPRQVHQFHDLVKEIMRYTNNQVKLDVVIRNVQQYMEEQENLAKYDALRLVLLSHNFEIRNEGSYVAVALTNPKMLKEDPPTDYWEDYPEDEKREHILKTWTPLNPVPSRGQPIEIMVMLMVCLLEENPLLAIRVDNAFEKVVERIALAAYGQGVIDEYGFRPVDVGGGVDEHVSASAGDSPRKRRQRATDPSLQADGGED